MDNALHNENLLLQYLDGELTTEEKTKLESRLRYDEVLQEQLRNLQVAAMSVRQYGMSQKIGSIHAGMMQELKSPQKKGRVFLLSKPLRYALAIAASVMVVWISVRLLTSSQPSVDSIYNEVFIDFPVSPVRGAEGLSFYETRYQEKDYNGIIAGTRTFQMAAKDSLLTGLAYLQTGRVTQAIGFFQRIANEENDLRQDGEFYLALSLLKSRQFAQALPLLEKIAGQPTHLYHSRVTGDVLKDVRALIEK